MDITIPAIVLGAIGALSSIVVSIVAFKRKSKRISMDFPKNSRKVSVEITEGRIGNITVGDNNRVSISNRPSDKEIKKLIENINITDQSQVAEKKE